MDSVPFEDYQNSLKLYEDPTLWEGPALRNSHQNGNLKALAAYLDKVAQPHLQSAAVGSVPRTSAPLLHGSQNAVPLLQGSQNTAPLLQGSYSSAGGAQAQAAYSVPSQLQSFNHEASPSMAPPTMSSAIQLPRQLHDSTLPLDSDDDEDGDATPAPSMGSIVSEAPMLMATTSPTPTGLAVPNGKRPWLQASININPLITATLPPTSKAKLDILPKIEPTCEPKIEPTCESTSEPPPKRTKLRPTRTVSVQTDPHLPLMDQILESGLEEAEENLLWDLHTIATRGEQHAAECRMAIEDHCVMWAKTWARFGDSNYARIKQGFEESLKEAHRKYTMG